MFVLINCQNDSSWGKLTPQVGEAALRRLAAEESLTNKPFMAKLSWHCLQVWKEGVQVDDYHLLCQGWHGIGLKDVGSRLVTSLQQVKGTRMHFEALASTVD